MFCLFGQTPTSKVWVVSIGVGKYTRNFAALRTAADGARKIALAISDVNRDITTSYTLTTDAAEDINRPTKENVLQIFADLERQVRPNDRVIVYFCGHGVESKGKPYLLLMNVTDIKDEELLATGSLSVSWLRDKLNGLKCKERLLWLDACRVEALEASGDGDDGTGDALPLTTAMSTGARMTASGDGIAVTYHGCRAGESVYYSKDGPSFFNKALVEGLQGKATDVHGRITMASLSRYVNDRVPVLVTEQNPALQQHPDIYPTTIPDDALVLKSAPGAIACPTFAGQYGPLFAKAVFTRLSETGDVNLVERMQLDKALEELKLQESGLTDVVGAQKLGKLCNASYVLIGSSEKAPGGRLQVNVRLVGVEDGKQISGVAGECTVNPDDPDTWKPALQALAEDLLAAMRKNGITTRGGNSTAIPPKYQPPVTTQLTGSLRVTSEPAGATVYVGGDKIDGVTPLTVKGLRPGQYTILITRDGYGDVTQASTVKSNEEVVNTVTLPLLQGAIKVSSTPPGATITLDGEMHGVTTTAGLNIPGLSLGMHKVRISLADYREETRDVMVVNGGNKAINVQLTGLPGKVTISTSPKGARVQLDGVDSGNSLLTINDIAPGPHKVRVSLIGYASAAKEFVLSPNGTQMMTFDLTPLEKAQINVTSIPPGASIYINDKLQVEKTPAVFTLNEIGEELQDVKVEVQLQEYQPVSEIVKIKISDQKSFNFTLQKGPAPTKTNSKDGAEMILIPAGDFLMGSTNTDINTQNNGKPQRKVYLDAYYMYKTEVTVAQYRKFCAATGRKMPDAPDWGWQENHPIVYVTWNDVKAYSDWAGVSLPTEAQWEKAARGNDGCIYPWGNEWDDTKCANFANSGNGNTTLGTHPVCSFPTGASPYGVMDMAGNVWEWCADWYSSDYYNNASVKNPTGPATGERRVLRGGSWGNGGGYYYRVTFRLNDFPTNYGNYIGFRCASPGP
jgi:formylglycine-generating enzyme required for sulfatase activity